MIKEQFLEFSGKVKDKFITGFNKSKSAVSGFINNIKTKLAPDMDKAKELFNNGVGHAKSFTRDLKENIVSGFDKIKTVALGAKDGIMNTLSNAGKGLIGSFQAAF